jgi:2',3'-cyclic-nucleotide 2'-phosphodiesterase (5'-nucleotidase family)
MQIQISPRSWLISLFIVVTGCSSTGPSGEREPSSNKALQLTVTSHRFLELEPCGCSLLDYGGMARELNLLNQSRAAVGADNSWHFYTGVTFSRMPAEKSKLSPAELEKKQAVELAALNVINPKALLFDADDFGFGVKRVEAWKATAKFPFINASIVTKSSGKSYFDGHLTAQWNGKDILIVGISEPPSKASLLPKELSWRKPGAAMDATFKAAGNKFDLVVVLASLNKTQRAEVLKTVGNLPVIFLGGPRGAMENASAQRESANSAYLNAMERGRAVGKIQLTWPPGDAQPTRIQSPYYPAAPAGVASIEITSSMDGITKNFETPPNAIHALIKKYREEMALSARGGGAPPTH